MADYPLGGIDTQTNTVDSVALFDVVHKPFTFTPTAADTLYSAGLLLARKVADDDLVPYVNGAGDSTGVPIAVLGSDVLSDAGPADVNLRAIVSGQVRQGKLHTLAAGPGVALVADDIDLLQQVGIISLSTTELSKLDNLT